MDSLVATESPTPYECRGAGIFRRTIKGTHDDPRFAPMVSDGWRDERGRVST